MNDDQKSKEQLIQELLELRREVATLKNTERRDCSAPTDLGLDQLLMDSLPHPAMLIRTDRTVLAANLIAQKLGARVGGYCWRDFGRSEFIPEEHKRYINQHNVTMPPGGTKCSFCLSDEAIAQNKPANAPEISAFGRLWSTWWVPISDDTYLHYAIDITRQKEIEIELKGYQDHLEKLVRERTSELALANEQLKSEITERGLTEEALRESEARFRSIFEKSLVVKLMVHPDFRRRGLARLLMARIEDKARALGRSLLTLDTRTGDHAEPLYESIGYRTSGIIPGYCLDPFKPEFDSTTIMFKQL